MHPSPTPTAKRSFEIADAYYILFRHKWKILIFTLIGLIAGGIVYRVSKPPYRSVAKLLIRFVITEGKTIGRNADDSTAKSPDQRGETIMSGEREILTSGDLARRVAEAVGPEKLLAKAGGGKDIGLATGIVRNGLSVTFPTRSSVIYVSFEGEDPEVVQAVLREVIATYLKMHVEAHRSAGMLSDSLVQETDQLRARLAQTEEDLRKIRLQAGVVTVDAAKQSFNDQIARVRDMIFTTQSDLAAQNAILDSINKRFPERPPLVAPQPGSDQAVPPAKVEEFRAITSTISNLQASEQSLATQFTAESPRMKEVRALLAAAEEKRHALLAEFPNLIRANVTPQQQAVAPSTSSTLETEAIAAMTQIAALQARLKVLNTQLESVRADAAKVDQLESSIRELSRKRELDEANYRYLAAALEQSRINETLGNGHVTNIGLIQAPSAPFPDRTKTYKIAGGLALGGLLVSLLWAAATELVFDRSMRRPRDVERQLNIPLFLTMPVFKTARKKKLKSAETAAGDATSQAIVPANSAVDGKSLVFHETLRDRLIGYFESKGLTHKPKLVAVTGVSSGAGVTSIAAGLARSLSETGDGNVLLVDFTTTHGSSQHFTNGKPHCELDELLAGRDNAQVESNLYVVAEGKNSEQLSRQLPQRFTKIVPKLKASDFDYIIFDMPPVSQISITPRLANYMDMVLLVVESEKTNQDVAQRAVNLLRNSKTHLGVVMNKSKTYIPQALDPDLLATV